MSPIGTLNIIGAGKVGRTLARLWAEQGAFTVQSIANRSRASAAGAAEFIGAGEPIASLAELPPADLIMISVPDDHIGPVAAALAAGATMAPTCIAFHVSGALTSATLAPLAGRGAALASVHPLKSFADPSAAIASFAGTWCAIEGEARARRALEPAFGAIGARLLEVDSGHKLIYHAASVFASNYLVSLLETALRAFEEAGVARTAALEVMAPLVRGTVDNVLAFGSAGALTGPIARGDHALVGAELAALARWDDDAARLYRELGRIALAIARERGGLARTAQEALERALG